MPFKGKFKMSSELFSRIFHFSSPLAFESALPSCLYSLKVICRHHNVHKQHSAMGQKWKNSAINKKKSLLRVTSQKFLKKSRQKNSWNQINKKTHKIAFLVVLNFFPVQKLIFGYFWNCKRWNLVKRFFGEIDLFDFMSFFGLDFF